MALRISIVSEHAIRMGAKATKVFGVHGGSIGRATDNEWILPDPERYLSGKHARIEFRAGIYYLVDLSSNGTFVNTATVPLGKYHEYKLKDGDYIRLGEFELLVNLDANNDFPAQEDAGNAHATSAKKSTANDIGADLDLSQLLEPSGPLADPIVPAHNAYGQAVKEEDAGGTPWHMMTRPLKLNAAAPVTGPTAASPTQPEPPVVPVSAAMPQPASAAKNLTLYDADFDAGLSAFCRGAGIDPRTIPPEARSSALQLAGQILRETVLGLMDLHQGAGEFRNRFRISPSPEAGESPLNFSHSVDETLLRLVTTLSTRGGSVEAVREKFREQKAQNAATIAAMRAAFEEFLSRVDPKDLEERFERGNKRGLFNAQNKGKYWDLYLELYPGLAQRPTDGFPHLFVEAFAKAYAAKVRTLAPPPRRSGIGTESGDASDSGFRAAGEY